MDKTDLLSTAISYKMEIITLKEFETAVDAYCAALLQQTPCSTLRELIEQKLSRVTEALQGFRGDEINYGGLRAYENTLQMVLKLIDELQPVA